jgi:hypothetical protein
MLHGSSQAGYEGAGSLAVVTRNIIGILLMINRFYNKSKEPLVTQRGKRDRHKSRQHSSLYF